MEPDARYYRRRANEELAAANRAVTKEARERRMQLAGIFLERLKAVEANASISDYEIRELIASDGTAALEWAERRQSISA